MKFYAGVTDTRWFNYLSQQNPEDVNFWQPGGRTRFKVLQRGGPFLFKLKAPINMIGGVGFFMAHSYLPLLPEVFDWPDPGFLQLYNENRFRGET